MRGPDHEAKTQPLSAGPIPRPPPVYPRWLIVGSIVLFTVAVIAFYGIGSAALIWGNREDAAYNDTAGRWFARYDAALARFDTLVATPQPADPAWQTDVRQQLTLIKAVGADIRAYHPSFFNSTSLTSMISQVAANYDEFVRLYSYGLEKDDHGAMYRGLQARQQADHYVEHFRATVGQKKTMNTPTNIP